MHHILTGCNLSDEPGLFSGIQTDEARVRIGYRDWIKARADDDDATSTLIGLIKMEADAADDRVHLHLV